MAGFQVITEDNRLKNARELPHGKKRAARLQFYSDAAIHCLYMKELRNEVSHARNRCMPGEAVGALERMHNFMTFLAR